MNEKRRFVELDALRGIAAMAVVLFHYTSRFGEVFEVEGFGGAPFQYGHLGVHLFFVISGYVIFLTISKCRTGRDFLVSRFSRLYPVYWGAMLVTILVAVFFPLPGQSYGIGQIVVNTSMLQAYLKIEPIDAVYWTLAYELGFYFAVWALFVSGSIRSIDIVMWAWTLGSLLFHYYSHLIPHPLHYLLLINEYAQLFVAGIVFYKIHSGGWNTNRVGLLIAALAVSFINFGWVAGFFISVFFGLFLLAIYDYLKFATWSPLVFFGTISYSLYLIHEFVGWRIMLALLDRDVPIVATIGFTLIVVILLATSLTYLVERPALRYLRQVMR